MTALTSNELTRWRTSPAAFPVYAWVHKPAVVWAARVNQASFSYPLTSITYDTVTTGAYTDIRAGLTLCIGSTAGAWDLGRVRIKAPHGGSVADATKVYCQRVSQGNHDGEAAPVDNAYLTVYDLRMIWAKPPYITSTGVIYMEDDKPFSAAIHQMPVANAGPDVLKIVPVGTTSATVDFGQTPSTTPSPDYTITGYAWDFKDATPSSSSSAAPTGVSFPLGKRYISLTVTDSGGNTHTAYALVVVVNEADPDLLKGLNITQHIERIDGCSMAIDLATPLSVADYPAGTEVLVCTNVVADQEGLSDRQHMVFAGWLADEESSVTTERRFLERRTRLTLHSAADRLKALPLWKTTLMAKASPTTWAEMKSLSLDRLVVHFLHWHCSVLERVDLLPLDYTAWSLVYRIVGSSVPAGAFWEQLKQYVEAQAGSFVCDRYNRIGLRPDENLTPSVAQNTAMATATRTRDTTTRLDLTDADLSSLDTSYVRHPRYHWMWSEALYTNLLDYPAAPIPAFIIAPGPAPSQGAAEQRITEQVVISESEYRWREGNRYAARVNTMSGNIRATLVRPLSAIHPADVEYVGLTSDKAGGARVRGINAGRFLPVEVQYRYNHRQASREVVVTMEPEVVGWAAPTYVPPSSTGETPDLDLEFPPIEQPYNPGGGWLNKGTSRIFLPCTNGGAWTYNFGAGASTVWEYKSWVAFGAGLSAGVCTPDAFSYVGGGNTGAWVGFGNDRVYYVDLIARTWAHKSTFSTGGGLNIDSSILAEDFVVFARNEGFGSNTRVSVTVDNSTWNQQDITSGGVLSSRYPCAVFLSQRTPGKAWVQSRHASINYVSNVWVTTDYGATWNVETARNLTQMTGDGGWDQIYSPRTAQNPSELIWFAGGGTWANAFVRVNSTVQTDIRPSYGGYSWVPGEKRNGFSTAASDANRMLLAGTRWSSGGGGSLGGFQLFLTNGALGTPTWTPLANATGLNFGQCAIAGDNASTFYLWGGANGSNAAVAYSIDGGVTIVPQVGNLASFSPGKVVGLVGF